MDTIFTAISEQVKRLTFLLSSCLIGHTAWGQSIPNVHWSKPALTGKTVITSGGQIATLYNGISLFTTQGDLVWSRPKVDVYGDPSSYPEGLGALTNDTLLLISRGYVPKYSYSYRATSTIIPTGQATDTHIIEDAVASPSSAIISSLQDVLGLPAGRFAILANKSVNNQTITWIRTATWSRELTYPNPQAGPAADQSATKSERILNTPDGGLLVVGYYNAAGIIGDPFNATSPSTGWVAKLDAQGTILWQKLLTGFPFPNSISGADPGAVLSTYAITDVTLAADGNGFILVGSGYGFSSRVQDPPRAIMLELDLNGNMKRSKVFPVDPTPAYVTTYKGNDGKRYYALGNTDLSVPGFDYRVLKISADPGSASDPASLSLLDQRSFSFQYDGTPQERLTDIDVAGDGGLVLMGTGGLIKLLPALATPLTLMQPLYNCPTKQFFFRSSGGDGSPVSYMSIGITPWTPTAGPYTIPEYPDAEAFTLIARQASNPATVTTLVWDWRVVCGTPTSSTPINSTTTPGPTECGSATATLGQPLTLLPPSYDCTTGHIRFNVRGGNGSPIEFLSVGITGWTTNCSGQVDSPDLAADIRNPASSVAPFTLYARQHNPDGSFTMVQLQWDAKTVCSGGRLAAIVTNDPTTIGVTVLGNPTIFETVDALVTGVQGEKVEILVTTLLGQPIHKQTIDRASAVNQVRLCLGQSTGVFLVSIRTATQQKSIKINKL